jgi:hypothetical protein
MNSRFILSLLPLFASAAFAADSAPYPKSARITGIKFDRESLVRAAPGSDIWSCSWASNGQIYAAYGDGGGFGGTDGKGRVSIGVAEISGQPPDWKGLNIWGGFNPASKQPSTVGKGTLLAVQNRLYLYVSEQGKWNRSRLWRSDDFGKSWSDRGWIFPASHKLFAFPGLIEFGQAQSLNQDGYVYGFSDNSPYRVNDGRLYLFRVKFADIETLDRYEYFSGDQRHPEWSSDLAKRTAVFENPAGISWGTTCVYHAATGRFLLAAGVREEQGTWGLYESEHPWGPWRTIAHGEELPEWTYSPAEKKRPSYLHTFPAKWISADGKTLWCVFDRGDHFNLARCALSFTNSPPSN